MMLVIQVGHIMMNCYLILRKWRSWQNGADNFRGGDGPLNVSEVSRSVASALCKNFLSAAEEDWY